MLTPQDELLCHQLSTTFDHVGQSDLRWTERIVLYGFDTAGSVSVMTGLARYANRNIVDAYAMVTIDDRDAHVVRLSREADAYPERSATAWTVGPYTYEVVEPLNRVRATLADNEHGITLDLTFTGEFAAYEQTPAFFRSRGRVLEDARRFYQNGQITGSITVDGRRIDINPETWWFGRDHSWGTRRGGGGGSLPEGGGLQPSEIPDGVFYCMGILEFDDHLVHFAQRESADGTIVLFEGETVPRLGTDRPQVPIVAVDHDLTFRDDFRIVESGTFVTHDSRGHDRRISVRALSNFWPGLAGYDVYRDYASGMWRGPSYSDGFTVDVADPDAVRPVSMLSETFVEARQGDQVGHGLIEMVFLGAYPRYGYPGW